MKNKHLSKNKLKIKIYRHMKWGHLFSLIKSKKNLKYFKTSTNIKIIMNNNSLKYSTMLDKLHHHGGWVHKKTYRIILTHNILKMNHIFTKHQTIISLRHQITTFLRHQIITFLRHQIITFLRHQIITLSNRRTIICSNKLTIICSNKQTIICSSKDQIKNRINTICKRSFKDKCKNMFLNSKDWKKEINLWIRKIEKYF